MAKNADPIKLLHDKLDAEMLKQVKTHRKGPPRFRASEVAGCSRAIYYRRSGYVPQPRSTFLELVSQAGNLAHDYVRSLMLGFGIKLSNITQDGKEIIESPTKSREFTYNNVTFEIAARDDGFIEPGNLPEGEEEAIMELKSMGLFYHKYLTKAFNEGYTDRKGVEHPPGLEATFARIKEKHPNYVGQGTVTAMLNDKRFVYLLAVCRDNMAVGVYNPATGERHGGAQWEVTEDMREKILKKLSRIEKAVQEGKPPMAEYQDGSTECSRCDFYYLCHGANKRRLAGEDPIVKYPVDGVLDTED